jgi:glycosyltransferase involved in cell wall biosynthesis
LIESYRRKCQAMKLEGQVIFAGMQRDVRPYLWSAEGFVLPSYYETFSLVTFEAAAAGVPLVVSRLHGVEEFLVDGKNGYLIDPTPEGIRGGMQRLVESSRSDRGRIGAAAALSVRPYGLDTFVEQWKAFYAC